MPSAAFATGFLNSVFDQRDEAIKRRDTNTRDVVNFLVSSGRVKDYNDLLPFMETLFDTGGGRGGRGGTGGGKGKGGQQDPHALLAHFLNPAFKMEQEKGQAGAPGAGTTLGGQQRPSFPSPDQRTGAPLYTEQDMQQRQDQEYQQKKAIDFDFWKKEEAQKTIDKIEEVQAKPVKETGALAERVKELVARGMPQDQAENAASQQLEQERIGKTRTGAIGERTKELIAQGISAERAPQVAALQLERERGTKQQQAAQRLNTYMGLSRQALLTNTERYNEMKQLWPHLLATRIAGETVAQMRPDVVRLALARGKAALEKPTAADRDGQKEASKIVEQATKLATTMAGKQSSILTSLGIDDDEATIRRGLIQELSGGADPDEVEALANTRLVSPTGGAGSQASLRVAARKYLNDNKKQADDATIDLFLKNNPTFK
jgi:uncharacterized protein YoaH (UPF0181 family)